VTTIIILTITKRSGRYHNSSVNDNNDCSGSQSYFDEPVSLYKDNSRKPLLDWDKPLFGHKSSSLQKLLAKANRTTERATRFINKIKSRQLACANRTKSIPENATIRKEYIKCGKEICQHEHGPYFYAYWKDPESKKLKKKYIGDHMPKNEELNDDCNNNHIM
jgi:hypothetical protein